MGFPRNLSHPRRGLLHTVEFHLSDPRRTPIRPRALDQHVSNAAVAGLGDAASSDRRTGRPFFRHETEVPHELAGVVKTLHVSDFGGERHEHRCLAAFHDVLRTAHRMGRIGRDNLTITNNTVSWSATLMHYIARQAEENRLLLSRKILDQVASS